MTRNSLSALSLTALLAMSSLALATPAGAQTHVPGRGNSTVPNDEPNHADTSSCTEALGYLRRVYPGELAAVMDSNKVWVTPICMDEDSMFRTAGNAGALRQAIAANAAMRRALAAKAFGPDDVVGLRMTGLDKLTLYVHPFHY